MILEQIVADNLHELEARKRITPLAEVQRMALEQPPPLDFASALRGDRIQLIAEVKRRHHPEALFVLTSTRWR